MKAIERIQAELQKNGIEYYKIYEDRKQSAELFYIKKDIDIVRRTSVTDCTVTVYRDFESGGVKMRGSAAAVIYPDMSAEEISTALQKAYYAASFVKNKFYELPGVEAGAPGESASQETYDLTAEAFKMGEALFRAEDTGGRSFLNSAEIFAEQHVLRVVNSEGIDVNYVRYSFNGEFVTQCISNGQDVELHTQFAYRAPEYDQLMAKARAALLNTEDRAEAFDPPAAGKYAVMLSGTHVATLLDYYMTRTQGGMIYAGYSSYQKGCFIQGNETDFKGEKLNLSLKATVPYSAEGIRMQDRVLTEHGILKTIHCGARYAYYLGIEPTGDYSALECQNGTMPVEALQNAVDSENDSVLYVAAFSDFQMDAFSGQFGGEIRLAYLYQKVNGKIQVRKLTGGSVNGSILDAQNTMVFSKERYKDNTYEGPYAVRFDNISVAGCDIK